MIYILDASALIAYLNGETGSDVVEGLLETPGNTCFAHALNLCEVYYDAYRRSGEAVAERVIADLAADGVIERGDLDPAFWREVGKLKSRVGRISLADACGIALAQRNAAEFVSSDHHELDRIASTSICPILFIR
ncbi:MAG TPA: PIN domain-containing protein [Longimicrobium sp.]|nr:PIN domain-containing protein [Longimicrobium sp.]